MRIVGPNGRGQLFVPGGNPTQRRATGARGSAREGRWEF